MRCFPKFYSWDCFVRLQYEVIIFYRRSFREYSGQIAPSRNFTESKFILVASQLCLLWFGVNFCVSYDFSSKSQCCVYYSLVWIFACHMISPLVSSQEYYKMFSNLNLEYK